MSSGPYGDDEAMQQSVGKGFAKESILQLRVSLSPRFIAIVDAQWTSGFVGMKMCNRMQRPS